MKGGNVFLIILIVLAGFIWGVYFGSVIGKRMLWSNMKTTLAESDAPKGKRYFQYKNERVYGTVWVYEYSKSGKIIGSMRLGKEEE